MHCYCFIRDLEDIARLLGRMIQFVAMDEGGAGTIRRQAEYLIEGTLQAGSVR